MPAAAVLIDNVDELRQTPDAKKLATWLADHEWRLDNLYLIKDENGNEIKFVRNEAQRAYCKAMWSRDAIVKARRLGMSTLIAIIILDESIFYKRTQSAIIDVKIDTAKEKLAMIKFAYDNLARDWATLGDELRARCPLIRNNTEELQWSNGSRVRVSTSARGSGLNNLHVSEYGKISTNTPDVAVEIKTGSMKSVPKSGWVVVESTAHGRGGEFYNMVKIAEKAQQEKRPLTVLDYRLHFFGWWIKQEHRLPNNLVVVSQKLREYFAEKAPLLLARHGVKLDADQQAWYAKQYEDLGPDKVKEEFPTLVEEAFFNSLEGAFWKEEIALAREENRIGLPVKFDPTRRVNTMWDIGEDGTAVIFFQTDQLRHRVIDYWEMPGSSLQIAGRVLDEKKAERKFIYDKHYGPHDLDNRDWAHESKTRKQVAADLGIIFAVVDRILVKADSIEAGRRMLNNTWVDSEHCDLLVQRWENYRKVWNKALGVFTAEPVHDESSHPADAWQCGAMGMKPEKPDDGGDRHRRKEKRKTSSWGA